MRRLGGYLALSAAATWVAYSRGVDDYYHQYSDNDGDNDLGFLRGFEWGYVALLTAIVLCVVVEIVYRKLIRKADG